MGLAAEGLLRLMPPDHEGDGDADAVRVACGDGEADPWLLVVVAGVGVPGGDALSDGATDVVWVGCGGAYVL